MPQGQVLDGRWIIEDVIRCGYDRRPDMCRSRARGCWRAEGRLQVQLIWGTGCSYTRETMRRYSRSRGCKNIKGADRNLVCREIRKSLSRMIRRTKHQQSKATARSTSIPMFPVCEAVHFWHNFDVVRPMTVDSPAPSKYGYWLLLVLACVPFRLMIVHEASLGIFPGGGEAFAPDNSVVAARITAGKPSTGATRSN